MSRIGQIDAGMCEASALSVLPALRIVQATAAATGASARAAAWLRAIDTFTTLPAPTMACYRLDATGKTLLPIAALGTAADKLPPISMGDLEHPAVYALVQRQPCLIDDARRLSGRGVAAWVAAMKRPAAFLALPLADVEQGRAIAVLVLGSTPSQLRAFQQDTAWSVLLEIFQGLLASACRHEVPAAWVATDTTQRTAAQRLEGDLIGASVEARRLRAEILAAADSAMAVLVTGETGVGKDHAAWLIHQTSLRRHKAFVPLNCAAIAPELIAGELFGAARGAYTGADRARAGLVAAADGGTLFLDEIGDMPLPLQATLLRLLNEKRYRPLGEVEERRSDFRLICATHQPLQQRVREGRFREDLYFRIRQLQLHVPPLRERRADIATLSEHVIARHNRERRTHVTGMTAEAQALLRRHPFPGNVRELITLVQVACERVSEDGWIDVQTIEALLQPSESDLGWSLTSTGGSTDTHLAAADVTDLLATDDLVKACAAFERQVIATRLRQHRGSRLHAARSLGIPKRTLAYKCKKFNLETES